MSVVSNIYIPSTAEPHFIKLVAMFAIAVSVKAVQRIEIHAKLEKGKYEGLYLTLKG